MPTEFVAKMREQFAHASMGDGDARAVDYLIDLVEEYGNALLSVGRSGSESFRKNGTEVDPKACAKYAISVRRDLIKTVIELKRENNESRKG